MISFNRAFEKFYFDFYISTVKEDPRKLGMLGFFSRAKIEECQEQTKKQGLVTQIHKANPSDRTGEWVLYFSKSKKVLEEAIELSHSRSQNRAQKNRKLGALYGYPKCCIDFFINLNEGREFDYLKKTLDNSSSSKFPFLTNRFTLNPFVFHVPCRFDCKETIRLAKSYIKIAQEINLSITSQILENLKAVVLITDDSAVSIAGFEAKRGKVFFKKKDFKKSLLLEEKIGEYIYKLTSNKKNFDFYFSNREMSRMKEGKWRKILAKFKSGKGYRISLSDYKDLEVILFV